MDKREVIRTIRKFGKALRKHGIPVDCIVLYGSHASGKAGPDSDIDVAVISGHFGKDKVDEGMALFRIAGTINSRLEPVPISDRSYEQDMWIPLIYEIRKTGIEVKI